MRLPSKVAIITGGANGIGRGTVEIFLRQGASVVIADRDTENGAQLASTSEHALFVEADVSNDASVARLIDKTVAHFGGVATPLAARIGRQPFQRLPHLSRSHSAPDHTRWRRHRQHRLCPRDVWLAKLQCLCHSQGRHLWFHTPGGR